MSILTAPTTPLNAAMIRTSTTIVSLLGEDLLTLLRKRSLDAISTPDTAANGFVHRAEIKIQKTRRTGSEIRVVPRVMIGVEIVPIEIPETALSVGRGAHMTSLVRPGIIQRAGVQEIGNDERGCRIKERP